MANITDVARHAGVSKRTVSRVLNEDPGVLPRTRKLVVEATEALGFIPNQAARSLRGSRTRTIGLVLLELNASLLQVVSSIEEVTRQRGYALLVCDSQSDRSVEAANLRRLYEHRVEGIVVFMVSDVCPEVDLFAKQGIPALAIHSVGAPDLSEGVGHVLTRGQDAAKPALRYLAELGHRRIGVVYMNQGPRKVPGQAFREAMLRLGLEYDPALEIVCDQPADCVPAVAALLEHPDRPTAIHSVSHTLCPFILEGIQAAGLSIPDDLSFVTLGDSQWTRAYRPPLTTLFYDIIGQGRLMAEYVFARIDGNPAESILNEIRSGGTPHLIVRSSCAAPPARSGKYLTSTALPKSSDKPMHK